MIAVKNAVYRKISPTLVEMLQYCSNVQHLSIPSIKLDPDQLGNVIRNMRFLQSLELEVDEKDTKQLLLNTGQLRVLTIHHKNIKEVFKHWMELQLSHQH